jgi:hypothetical protein
LHCLKTYPPPPPPSSRVAWMDVQVGLGLIPCSNDEWMNQGVGCWVGFGHVQEHTTGSISLAFPLFS